MTSAVVALGLVSWLLTLIVVEAEVTRAFRGWFVTRMNKAMGCRSVVRDCGRFREPKFTEPGWFWFKARYLVSCHLCTGVWVSLALAALVPDARPLGHGFVGYLLSASLIKAVGHLTLVLHKAGEKASR